MQTLATAPTPTADAQNLTDSRKSRKAVFRRTIDYNASIINYLKDRLWIHSYTNRPSLQPDLLWSPKLYPPKCYMDSPVNCVMSKPVRTSTNKNKCPIYCVCWTPEGRRLITGAFSGEFTLWNGLTFNFETILQAHESQIRCMKWSHNDEWLLTADHSGYVKYWQANMNNVEMYQAHKEPIRGVSFCPFDNKFVTCSDDSTVRIWDFHRCAEERVLRGHGSDVRSVAWHPTLSLLISGSKDAQQPIKLWDPKTGESVITLYIHKNTCTDVSWNDNGNWFLTASRDHLIKLFDLRNLKSELQTFRGHKRDVMRVAWHPFHECLFASGSADGSIFYWLAGTDTELGAVENAHESMIWSLAWHPFGHILVSGANDFATKFWTRSRPGEVLKECLSGSNTEGIILTHGPTASEADALDHLTSSHDALKSTQEFTLTGTVVEAVEELAFVSNPDDLSVTEIPGLNEGAVTDLNVNDGMDDNDDRSGSKLRSTRTIPKEFAANWASTRITAMPTVMMMPPAPNPTQIVSAVAAAAAAVSDLTSTPQYLPPLKPPPSVTKERPAPSPAPEPIPVTSKPPNDHSQGVCTRPQRPMNYLGQPPAPPETLLPQRDTDTINPVGIRGETRETPANWKDNFEAVHPPDSNSDHGQPPRLKPHLANREPFEQPPIQQAREEFTRHMEDRDYRDFERREPNLHPPGPPPAPFTRPPLNHGSFNHPGRPHQPPIRHDRIPVGPHRGFPPDTERFPYDVRSDNYPPEERKRHFPESSTDEPWDRSWPEDGPNRFQGYPPHGVPRRPPPRFPPPPQDKFYPEPGMNFGPPHKRPPPSLPMTGPLPPELRHKHPRPDGHWGDHGQW
ncbi:unnamed protein product [Dicrocoelium dendriticum]|nr:unnamed protein product [Dicrocoelium dendriticum]